MSARVSDQPIQHLALIDPANQTESRTTGDHSHRPDDDDREG